MSQLDEKETSIVREIIRNPRISDNAIARKTSIPLNTVNRKRKEMEGKGLISYHAVLNQGPTGTGRFSVRHFYRLTFKLGLTPNVFVEKMLNAKLDFGAYTKFISFCFLGEMDGHLVAGFIIEGKDDNEVSDFFNSKVVPRINLALGENSVDETITIRISEVVQRLHNYLPRFNMQNGMMKDEWPDEWICVE